MKKKSKLVTLQDTVQSKIAQVNSKIEALGEKAGSLCETLLNTQKHFDLIRNISEDKKIEYDKVKKTSLEWKQQVEKIDKDYKDSKIKDVASGIAGVGTGVAVVTLGPSVAMGVATTFGVASTGTAISTLSGAAATNAALAWLGGGALAAGGGGMSAGAAFLALANPVGIAIGCMALVTSAMFLFLNFSDKKRLENIFISIGERDINKYKLALVELNERIPRISDETEKLNDALDTIESYGLDYAKMTEKQQYELGAYVNLMSSATQLLVNPIESLLPKYTNDDFEKYCNSKRLMINLKKYPDCVVYIANLLYNIALDKRDKKLIWKTLRKNKLLLETLNINKNDFTIDFIDGSIEAVLYKKSKNKRDGVLKP